MNERFLGVGIDVSKKELCIAIGSKGKIQSFANDPKGIAALVEVVTAARADRIILEATGKLHWPLVWALDQAKQPVVVANPRHTRAHATSRGRLAKTDAIDARDLALYGELIRPELRPLLSEIPAGLHELLTRRKQVQEIRKQEQGALDTTFLPGLRERIRKHIEQLQAEEKELEDEIAKTIEREPVWKERAALLTTIPGIGPICAASLIAFLPELGTLDSNQLAALVGVAPFNRDSGGFRGKRRIWGGRNKLRSVLFCAVGCAGVRFNPALRPFYERLRARGKGHKQAVIACVRKLLTIINAMIRKHSPWNPELVLADANCA